MFALNFNGFSSQFCFTMPWKATVIQLKYLLTDTGIWHRLLSFHQNLLIFSQRPAADIVGRGLNKWLTFIPFLQKKIETSGWVFVVIYLVLMIFCLINRQLWLIQNIYEQNTRKKRIVSLKKTWKKSHILKQYKLYFLFCYKYLLV